MFLDVGSVAVHFNLGRYSTQAELARAIEALPMVTARGNDIPGAMRTLLSQVLAYGYRGYNNYIQKVALIFVDDRATNRREVEAAYQVLRPRLIHL